MIAPIPPCPVAAQSGGARLTALAGSLRRGADLPRRFCIVMRPPAPRYAVASSGAGGAPVGAYQHASLHVVVSRSEPLGVGSPSAERRSYSTRSGRDRPTTSTEPTAPLHSHATRRR